jgi:hypothetical protein
MLNLLQLALAAIFQFIIFLATSLKLIAITIIAQFLILFLFVVLFVLRTIASFLRFLIGEEED